MRVASVKKPALKKLMRKPALKKLMRKPALKKLMRKPAKPALVRRLARQIERGLEREPIEKVERVVVLFERAPAVGRRIVERVMAEAAAAAPGDGTLRGEGLRAADEAERGRIDEALGRARARGEEAVSKILARPEMLTGETFATRADATRETVNRWRKEGRVLGLEGNTRGVRYPDWQIDERGRVTDLRPFLNEVRDPWVAYRFLASALAEFGGMTGIEVVRRGRSAELVDVVRHFGETF
jgi:hypothetical protein